MKTKPCITESLKALNRFAAAYTKARALFNPVDEMNPKAWLTFYESKMTAYLELCGEIPQIKEIPDFWRWVQGRLSDEWIPLIEKEISRITSTAECSCGANLEWPEKLCKKCRTTKKTNAKAAKKSRKAVKKRMKAYEK